MAFATAGGPPPAEVRAIYAPELHSVWSDSWDAKTRAKYEELRREQIKLADMERELYDVAWTPTEYAAAKFRQNIEALKTDGAPKFSNKQYVDIDKELNKTFQESIRTFGTVQGECKPCQIMLRNVEKQWLRYRDAWAEFGMTLFPKSRRTEWLAWLSQQRIKHIESHDVNGP